MSTLRRLAATTAVVSTIGLTVISTGRAGAANIGKGSAFCRAANAAVTAALPQTPNDQSTYTAADKEANKVYGAILVKSIDAMVKDAPAEIKADLTAQRTMAAGIVKTGVDPEGATPGLGPSSKVAEVVGKNCRYAPLTVNGGDYKFSGVGTTLKAGVTTVTLKNTSKSETHHMVLLRRQPSQKDPVLKVLSAPEPVGVDFLGFVGDNKPGETKSAIVNLNPGTYIFACFLPVGGAATGAPHFTKGMYGEFNVK